MQKTPHFRLYRLSWPVFILIRIQYDKTAKLPKQPWNIQVNTRKHPVTHFVQEDNKTEKHKTKLPRETKAFQERGKNNGLIVDNNINPTTMAY